ncbi:CSPP1 [Branchiostoma lanceolatum]|uniref:CSPP1 protein n=1 Tax=Branchiostoma lanceolatum TaxID=7740 RepID=A0A8K0EK73_BRALA|nr:CSPP1 [Branchiostoma lanceolatum]
MSDDIEKFIEQQKQKITAERQELGIPADPDISPSHGVNNGPSKENIPPTQGSKRDSGGPVEFGGLKLGGYEDHRKKLQEERKREYNQLLNEKKFRSTGVNSRIQEIEHANKSLPRSFSEPQGLNNDQGSRTFPQRRRDTSPLGKETYDDILKRKREEEDRYRRLDDPEMITDRRRDDRLRDHPLRASRSDGFLNEPDDRRHRSESGWLKGLGHDRLKCELCQRRARLSGEWDQGYDRKVNRLDDDYGSRHVRFREKDDYVDDDDRRDWSRSRAGRRRDLNSAEGERPSREKDDKDRAHSAPPEDGFVIGNQERASAVRRKKDAYRQDLMRQMADNERARKKEKSRDMRINASGENDPEKLTSVPEEEPGRIRDLPPTNRQPNRQRGRDTSPYRPYHTLDDEPEGRDRRQDRQRTPPYRPQQAFATPPPQPQRGLGPQPMGYMQPGVVPANPYFMGAPMIPVAAPLSPYRTPYDDAYYYYGMRHPLDPNIGGAGGPVPPTGGPVPPLTTLANGRSDSLPVPSINIPNLSPRGPEFTREDAARKRTESRIQDMVADDDTRKSQEAIEKQRQYQEDLKEQMRLRDLKKQKERDEKERYDRKLEAEAQNYNPWGKGGGGAPLRNSDGRVVADLRKMHIQNEEDQLSPRNEYSDKPVVNLEVNMASLTEPPRQPPIKESQALNMYTYKSPFARKNKVFEDEDNEQKNQRDEYQSELQRQVEEKKRRQEEEKRKQKEEEDREERRLAEQRERMQQEYEAEQRKQRDKEEEVKRKNEELKQLAEERRQEVERKKREEDEKHDQERRRQLDEEDRRRREEQQRQRVSSPPIPTLRKNEEESHQPPPDSYRERPPPSPPVPAVRTRERAPGNPHDVIDQLSAMRAQLQSEQRRVQSQLDHAKFDSVPAPKPQPPPPRRELTGVDIFDMARNRSRVAVRRPVQTADTSADPRNLEDFNDLKHRKNTVSRQEFRSRYPDDPYTARGLEAQQYAMLQQQEEKLGKLRQGGLASEMPNMGPRDLGLQRGDDLSRKSLLDSESAFIDLNGEATFPPDMVDERKGPTARERRRQQRKSPSPHLLEKDELSLGGDSYLEAQPGPSGTQPGNFGSLTSLDVDRVAAKNEERLRRLKTLQGDDQSIGDPDDILQRFMNQQKHNRPSSTTTLDTEAWLRPGTGNTSLLSKT